MGNKTIGGSAPKLDVVTSAAAGDLIIIWRDANGDTRAITKEDFIDAILTGGGTIATGGNTLTISGNSVLNGSLVGSITGSGTIATGGFTLTIPATGTASLLGTAQTYSALKTFSAGINLGNTTLSNYLQSTWTPTITGSTSNPTVTYTTQTGQYTRIGNVIFYTIVLSYSAFSGGSGDARVSLPVAVGTGASGVMFPSNIDLPGTPVTAIFSPVASQTYGVIQVPQDDASHQTLQISGLAAFDILSASGFYFV